jgi:hypothetical protein
MDFVADTLGDRRGFRTLNIVDDFSHECPVIEVDRSLPRTRVVRVLDQLAETTGLPKVIVCDNSPEFASRTLDAWPYRRGVELRFIRRGKRVENAFVESFNGKFRDECLNEHWFRRIAEAQRIIEAWRIDYNTVRPHRSLGQLTPAAYAAAAADGRGLSAAAVPTSELSSLENRRDFHYPRSGFGGRSAGSTHSRMTGRRVAGLLKASPKVDRFTTSQIGTLKGLERSQKDVRK